MNYLGSVNGRDKSASGGRFAQTCACVTLSVPLGSSQVVRQQVLILRIEGSNPSSPTSCSEDAFR